MKILSNWLRSYVPGLAAGDRDLAEALTLRGIAVEGVFDLGPGNGSLFEMDITTNRVDAMNHYGVAREAAAIHGLALAPLDHSLPPPAHTGKPVEVFIEALDLCGRFTARALGGVAIVPSTGLVRDRFELLQQKLISNAVDATNYVLMAMGHPTHAFDRDKLEGGVILRRARQGERLRTLDGVERVLDREDLVVADERKPLALAGVIGGWETMIAPETNRILIEAAWFDPGTVRRTGKRHGLRTEASHRFERGADFEAPPVASALVAKILLAPGGSIDGDLVDIVNPEIEARTARRSSISLSRREVNRILGPVEGDRKSGAGVSAQEAARLLASLGCRIEEKQPGEYSVHPPSWRLDIEREADLIEEIARVHGYNRFQDTLPPFTGFSTKPPHIEKEAAVRRCLLALGWNAAISNSFCSAEDAAIFSSRDRQPVELAHPLSEEAGMLRPSLLPGMLAMVANNLNRGAGHVQLFETGTVFESASNRVREQPSLALGAAGVEPGGAHAASRALSFYDLKGAIEDLLSKFAIESLYFDNLDASLSPSWLHPFRSARAVVNGATAAWFGEMHPREAQRRKIRQSVYLAEVHLNALFDLPLRRPMARELSRFQSVDRDFSFIFPGGVAWRQIVEAIERLRIGDLQSFAPREIFRHGEAKLSAFDLPPDSYSILIGVTFQSAERTLKDEEIKSHSQSIAAALESLGGKQRA